MKKINPKLSLYLKFNIIIVGSIFLCGILTGAMFFYTLKLSMGSDLEQRAHETALSLESVISNDVLLDNKFSVYEQLLNTMKYNDQIRYIIVTSPDNDIIASTFPNGFPVGLEQYREPQQLMMENNIDTVRYSSNEGDIREIMTTYNNGVIGSIRIGISENVMNSIIRKRIMQISISLLIICLFASLLASLGASKILLPLRKIAHAMKSLGQGKQSKFLDIHTGDEIENLATSFNKMSQNLSRKQEENNYLITALQEKEEKRIYLLTQLFNAREDERRHLSQELHDQTSQSMVTIMAYLRILHNRLDDIEDKQFVLDIRDLTAQTLDSIRALALHLHPPLLRDLGLIQAIEKYIDVVHSTHPDLVITLEHYGDFSKVEDMLNLTCYRLMQEGITNIQKHAQAHRATIILMQNDDYISIDIIDDGIGFSRETANNARRSHHLGLMSMEERIQLLQGDFQVYSHRGKGTHIKVKIPMKPEANI